MTVPKDKLTYPRAEPLNHPAWTGTQHKPGLKEVVSVHEVSSSKIERALMKTSVNAATKESSMMWVDEYDEALKMYIHNINKLLSQ